MLDCKPYCEQSSHRCVLHCIMHDMSTAVHSSQWTKGRSLNMASHVFVHGTIENSLLSVTVRRASSVICLHFHLLLENTLSDFNQTWQESFFRGIQTCTNGTCGSHGGPRGGPPRAKSVFEFQASYSPDQYQT